MEDANLYIIREIVVSSDNSLNTDILNTRIVELELTIRTLNSLKNEFDAINSLQFENIEIIKI